MGSAVNKAPAFFAKPGAFASRSLRLHRRTRHLLPCHIQQTLGLQLIQRVALRRSRGEGGVFPVDEERLRVGTMSAARKSAKKQRRPLQSAVVVSLGYCSTPTRTARATTRFLYVLVFSSYSLQVTRVSQAFSSWRKMAASSGSTTVLARTS